MDDEYVTVAETAIEGLSKMCIPGAFWVDTLPLIRYIPSWVPGTKSVNFAKKYVPLVIAMKDKPFAEVETAMVRYHTLIPKLSIKSPVVQAEGTALPSVASSIIKANRLKYENPEDYSFFREIANNVTGIAYAGMPKVEHLHSRNF